MSTSKAHDYEVIEQHGMDILQVEPFRTRDHSGEVTKTAAATFFFFLIRSFRNSQFKKLTTAIVSRLKRLQEVFKKALNIVGVPTPLVMLFAPQGYCVSYRSHILGVTTI